MLLFEQALSEEELYYLGSYILTITFGDVIALVEEEAKNKGYPAPDPTKLEYILKRSLEDYRAQITEFEDGNIDEAEFMTRNELTNWYNVWTTFNEGSLNTLKKAGLEYIEWTTQRDSSVCEICQGLEGVYEINSAPEMPNHIGCRCFWSLPTAPQPLDSRDALSRVHEEFMKKIMARN